MEWLDISVARTLVYLTLLPAAGLPLYFLYAKHFADISARSRAAAAGLAALAVPVSALWLLASVAAMSGLALSELDRETVIMVAQATPLGTVMAVRALALLSLAATILPKRVPLVLPAICGLVAISTLAFSGHAGATEGTAGLVHRFADLAHLAGAACWLAALLHFVASAFGTTPAHRFERQLARFAATGTVIVVVLAMTGLVNVVMISGIAFDPASLWIRLLTIKIALFAAMLCFAGLNRWRLTPALAAGAPQARQRLRLSLIAELGCGLGVVGLVAVLGTLDPAGV